ncbi:hypothetical protein AAGV33_02370 [Flavobacterium sp. FBOR7N2.3]|uniref:DUF4199 domain-containing protein n=1 Tax=Flavobacterium magnesitis TaxID=3138077 RepID=A0ABV4TIK9_9FLAO
MKLPKELYNGIIIFIGIAIYFVLIEMLQLTDVFYLRLLNILFVYYGVNKTLQSNYKHGKNNFGKNAISAFVTGFIGISLSIIGVTAYIYSKGGDEFIESLSYTILYPGEATVMTYVISLFIEAIVSVMIVSFSLLLFWKRKYPSD